MGIEPMTFCLASRRTTPVLYPRLVRLPSFELGCSAYETDEIANTSQDAYNDLLSNLISSIALDFSSLSLVPTRRYSMRHAMCFSVVIITL